MISPSFYQLSRTIRCHGGAGILGREGDTRYVRWFAAKSRKKINHQRRNKRFSKNSKSESPTTNKSVDAKSSSNATANTSATSSFTLSSFSFANRLKLPSILLAWRARYRKSGAWYTWEHARETGKRLPLALVLAGFFLWDQTSPFTWVKPSGPSMLPTIAADGSEVWLLLSSNWFLYTLRLGGYFHKNQKGERENKSIFRIGDMVAFAPPPSPDKKSIFMPLSCKRVVGLPGDVVASNGQYVKLYRDQDPINLGKSWPQPSHAMYAIAEQRRQQPPDPDQTEVVPEGHVWLEADNPGLGLDSRQFGPIPESYVRAVVAARLWPIWSLARPKRLRPHPIPLDEATLSKYNVYRARQAPSTPVQTEQVPRK